MPPVKVAFVVPRYGVDIRGGAEVGARMLAERLVAERGYEVEVLTTSAPDAITWRDELPEGTSVSVGSPCAGSAPRRGATSTSIPCGRSS